MIEAENLTHGTLHQLNDGAVGVMFLSNPAYDGQPLRVELMVATRDGTERDFTLQIGDAFPVGGETWRVQGIDGVGGYDYVIRVARVPDGTA